MSPGTVTASRPAIAGAGAGISVWPDIVGPGIRFGNSRRRSEEGTGYGNRRRLVRLPPLRPGFTDQGAGRRSRPAGRWRRSWSRRGPPLPRVRAGSRSTPGSRGGGSVRTRPIPLLCRARTGNLEPCGAHTAAAAIRSRPGR